MRRSCARQTCVYQSGAGTFASAAATMVGTPLCDLLRSGPNDLGGRVAAGAIVELVGASKEDDRLEPPVRAAISRTRRATSDWWRPRRSSVFSTWTVCSWMCDDQRHWRNARSTAIARPAAHDRQLFGREGGVARRGRIDQLIELRPDVRQRTVGLPLFLGCGLEDARVVRAAALRARLVAGRQPPRRAPRVAALRAVDVRQRSANRPLAAAGIGVEIPTSSDARMPWSSHRAAVAAATASRASVDGFPRRASGIGRPRSSNSNNR